MLSSVLCATKSSRRKSRRLRRPMWQRSPRPWLLRARPRLPSSPRYRMPRPPARQSLNPRRPVPRSRAPCPPPANPGIGVTTGAGRTATFRSRDRSPRGARRRLPQRRRYYLGPALLRACRRCRRRSSRDAHGSDVRYSLSRAGRPARYARRSGAGSFWYRRARDLRDGKAEPPLGNLETPRSAEPPHQPR